MVWATAYILWLVNNLSKLPQVNDLDSITPEVPF